jgi:hypothetical protein
MEHWNWQAFPTAVLLEMPETTLLCNEQLSPRTFTTMAVSSRDLEVFFLTNEQHTEHSDTAS